MRRGLIPAVLLWALAALATDCSPAGSPPPPAPAPAAASPPPRQPAPATAILDASQVGLPLSAAEDGITPAQAANEVPDAADALPLFDSWGWLVESRRDFGRGAARVEVTVLLTLRLDGAESAFALLAQETAVPPLITGACGAGVPAADQCSLGQGQGHQLVVGRVGTEVFEVSTAGAGAVALAALQAARLRG
jgi:hypothetical protein